jgi:DNA-binding SARP family transcriptional activator/tetratricopeptide (TPR) repeat protein
MFDGDGGTVLIRLLGAVQAVADSGQAVEVGPPKRCAVLAALAVDAGRSVPVEVLLDRVWGTAVPAKARRGLHAHIVYLRRSLRSCADGATDRVDVVHRSAGYTLTADRDQVDLHRLRDLAARARLTDTITDRVDLLRQAVGLWAGQPLAGLAGNWAAGVRAGCLREYFDVMADWADAEIAVANPQATIALLTDLVTEHPLEEPLAAAVIRTLHAAGHTAEALACYTTVRQRLVEQLGVDPGPQLRQAHQLILHSTVEPQPGMGAPALVPVTPRQLPPAVAHFAGRTDALATLSDLLGYIEAGATVVISAIGGTAGVGKTTLAVHWAHRVADQFPDGQLYIDLRGFSPTGQAVTPAEAVRRLLDALQVPPARIPVDLDAQAALYRSQMAGRRMLVVLDNARDSAQARPLLPASAGCLVLVTSRNQLTGLVAADGAHPIDLDLLSLAEAHELLVQRLGPHRVAAEPVAVTEIITRCARLPLALALVAARAAARPRVPLQLLAGELADARQRWQTLTGDDPHTDVRSVFSWSYQALTPAAARLFRLLGLHPGPDIGAPAAASLAGITPDEARPLLAELIGASLLTEPTPSRYTFHDLLRDYATQLAQTIDTDQQRHTAIGRILDHYLHTAHPAERLLDPAPAPLPLEPPQAGVTPEQLGDYAQALGWFTVEHQVLVAAIDLAAVTGFDTHTWQLAWTVTTFLTRRGHWPDQGAVGQAAVGAAQRLADPTALIRAHRSLAYAYTRLGRFDDAHTQLHQALDLATRTSDQTQQAWIHSSLANLWEQRGQPAQALPHARQALRLFQAAGHQGGQAHALNMVGWCHTRLGEHQQALTYCQQALTLSELLGDRHGQANTWDSLGHAHHHLGQHTQALICYQHAFTLFEELGDRYYEATALTHFGDTHHATGDPQAAREAWQQALTILDDLNPPDAAQVRAKLASLDPPTDQPAL